MKKVIENKKKMKNTMMIVWGVFVLALFAITRFSPTYAENGIMLDGVIDKIAGTGEASVDQGAGGDDVLLGGKDVAEDGNPQTEDFYSGNQKIPSPQGWVSPLSKGELSGDDGEELPKAPQNDEGDVDNTPGSASMTDQDGNRDQNENSVEPGLNGKKDTKDSLLRLEGQGSDDEGNMQETVISNSEDEEFNGDGEDEMQMDVFQSRLQNYSNDSISNGEEGYDNRQQNSSLRSSQSTQSTVTTLLSGPEINKILKELDFCASVAFNYNYDFELERLREDYNRYYASYYSFDDYMKSHGYSKLSCDGTEYWVEMNPTGSSDFNVLSFVRSDSLPFHNATIKIISEGDMYAPHVYARARGNYDGTTILYYTEAEHIFMNQDSSHMFEDFDRLYDIRGVRNRDSSRVTDMNHMFNGCLDLADISPLQNWNVGRVENMSYMFGWNYDLVDLTPLSNRDVSSVKNMNTMFLGAKMSTLDGLSKWDTSSVTNMSSMFSSCRELTDISALSTWNTSEVTSMYATFSNCENLTDLTPLTKWDVSKVTDMNRMFWGLDRLQSLSGLDEWDVSSVTRMTDLFEDCKNLTDISALSERNIGNADLGGMFLGCVKLEDISPLSGWDVSNVLSIGWMFASEVYYNTEKTMKLRDISALSNWDVSNVTNMQAVFRNTSIDGIQSIMRWNIDNVVNFDRMFQNTLIAGTQSSFVVRSGYVDDQGTYIPYMKINFESNGGTDTPSQTVEPKSFAIEPTVPNKTGHLFAGRFRDMLFIDKWDFNVDKVNENMTLYAKRIPNVYTITFDTDGGSDIAPITGQYNSPVVVPLDPTKTGYTFVGRDQTIPVNIPANDITITAQRTINQYTITFVNDDGSVLFTGEYNYGTSGADIIKPSDPTKTEDSEYRYTFSGWSPVITDVTGHATYTATYTPEKKGGGRSGGGGRGGGGGGENPSDPIPTNPQHPSADDPEDKPENKPTDPVPSSPKGGDKPSEKQYKPETIDAYNRAYANNFTQYANINEARLSDPLNRSEMAKITSIFATQFLDKIPDESKQKICSKYSDMRKVDNEMKYFITQSCELGYMGYRENGIDIKNRFYPYTSLTLAEASTVLSRIMRGTDYALEGKDWYKGHLYAVYNNELVDDIRKPFSHITREQAFLMLYRMYKNMEK